MLAHPPAGYFGADCSLSIDDEGKPQLLSDQVGHVLASVVASVHDLQSDKFFILTASTTFATAT